MSKNLSLIAVPLWTTLWQGVPTWLRRRLRVPAGDLLRDATYRRLWASILISSFGGQVTMLALPLTAAVLLQATPTQMGLLTSIELAPFVLLSLPATVCTVPTTKPTAYSQGIDSQPSHQASGTLAATAATASSPLSFAAAASCSSRS